MPAERKQMRAAKTLGALRKTALRMPETSEGIACAGTSLETRTVEVRGKAFLFLRAGDLRLKLGPSLSQARALAAKDPTRCEVGSSGWVRVVFADDGGRGPSPDALARWVEESWSLLAPKSVLAAARAGARARPR